MGICMNTKIFSVTLLITSFCLMINITGCGQSGPLVLPKPTVVTSGATSTMPAANNKTSNTASPSTAIKTVT